MTYKKRAQNGWCKGKYYKNESNRSERQFEKKELREELEVYETDAEHIYPYKSSPSVKRARMTPAEREINKYSKLLAWYEKLVGRYEGRTRTDVTDWASRFYNECKDKVLKYKEKINIIKKRIEKK